MTQGPSQGSTRIYSLISTIFLALTALTLCGVIGYAVAGPKSSASSQPTAIAGFPTSTSTLGGPTPPSTWTPAPFSSPTATRPATRTPEATNTATPTNTATGTLTLTPSNTPAVTFTPIPPPRKPFDYVVQGGAAVLEKNGKFSGCDAVIAGVVEDQSGNQASQVGMRVHITGNEANKKTTITKAGDDTDYGQSGWEYYFNNHVDQRTYGVQLQYPDGAIASDVWQITTSDSCKQNLAFVTFIQVQPRQ
jgi:hypothetical protein